MIEASWQPGYVLHGASTPTTGLPADEPLLTLALYRPSGWSVVEAVGEMDTQSIARLRSLLQTAGPNVVLDLRSVTFMDASGLGVLATCGHGARRLGGAVRLVGPSRQIRRLLALTRLDQVLPIYESMEEALTETARTA
jgi:anti-sigma B factor antagonist